MWIKNFFLHNVVRLTHIIIVKKISIEYLYSLLNARVAYCKVCMRGDPKFTVLHKFNLYSLSTLYKKKQQQQQQKHFNN